ncbi:MAG: DNA polymerase domain-containing protein [Rudaea sp.]
MRTLEGWLFDVYAQGEGVSAWLIDAEGAAHHLRDQLEISFFVGGEKRELHAVCAWLRGAGLPVRLQRAERYDLFLRSSRVLLEVRVRVPALYERIVRRVTDTFPTLDYYNADLTVPQVYYLERDLFPLAHCEALVNEANEILDISAEDSPWDLDYALPPLRTMLLRLEGENRNPNHGYRAPLEITYDERTYVVEAGDSRHLVTRVRDHLMRADPDVILTDWGDSFLLPQLLELARQYGVDLTLNRDTRLKPHVRPAQSYFSYGRIIYKTSSQLLFGRWHIDRENAFLTDDYGLDGALEVARLTKRPVQQTVRTSTGSGISAMEVNTAYKMGYLIPWRKREPEEFKSALDLLVSDKGGLTYQPISGLHYGVAELDFASMYPAIMARFNVSPETIHCRCCQESRVPEIGYPICRKQKGLVPQTLAPLIEKRFAYKRALRQAASPDLKELYRRRVSAHKWLLVTCFGYLGYKNARFGKIEAHEAVTAYGREALLRAKEVAEDHGFRVLHALTDSLWIQKPGTDEREYETLVHEIEGVTNLPLALDGLYKWVAFLPSRVDARRSVPNRYFGTTEDGELKIRGIELRRHDTPALVKRAQQELLDELARTTTRADVAAAVPRLLQIVLREIDRLRAGQAPLHELVLRYHLSRDPAEYQTDTLNAIVARELAGRGVTLNPGESIRYVITENQAEVPADRARAWEFIDGSWGYDVERYTELLLRATESVLQPFGISASMLRSWLVKELPAEHLRARLEAGPARPYLGPLFEWRPACKQSLAQRCATTGHPGEMPVGRRSEAKRSGAINCARRETRRVPH